MIVLARIEPAVMLQGCFVFTVSLPFELFYNTSKFNDPRTFSITVITARQSLTLSKQAVDIKRAGFSILLLKR